jgi:polyvinyl alcohol dehydrogenase (cytochrome)
VQAKLASAAALAGVFLGALLAVAAQDAAATPAAATPAPTAAPPAAATSPPAESLPPTFVVANPCPEAAPGVSVGTAQWNGWGRDPDNSRYQPEPALRASDTPKLRLKWAYGLNGAGDNGQPSIVDGRVFTASSTGRVYALDARSGCTYWTFPAGAAMHGALVVGELAAPRTLFGLRKIKLKKNAHIEVEKPPCAVFVGDEAGAVYALDARSGQLLWKTQADTQPGARITGAPALYRNRLYVPVSSREEQFAANPSSACCTFRGSVVALDVATGRQIWKTYMSAQVPESDRQHAAVVPSQGAAGFAVGSTPTIDVRRDALYVTTGGAHGDSAQPAADAVVALSLGEGAIRWVRKLGSSERAGDADRAPILRDLSLSKQILVVTDAEGVVFGLDPDRGGEPLWQSRLAIGGESAIQWGAAVDHRSVYAQFARDNPGAAAVAAPGNGLVALDLVTGKSRWAVPSPDASCGQAPITCREWQSQAVTVIPGIAFSGSFDGHLRAYSTIDGKVVWDVATARGYATVNAQQAQGGTIANGGVSIVGGTVYVNSGDALLAFSVDGK